MYMKRLRRNKFFYTDPGTKIKLRKGKIIEQHTDLFAAKFTLTTGDKNLKNRYYCDFFIKASKVLKSLYPRGEKSMSDRDKTSAIRHIDTMMFGLDAMKREILNETNSESVSSSEEYCSSHPRFSSAHAERCSLCSLTYDTGSELRITLRKDGYGDCSFCPKCGQKLKDF